MQAEVKKTKIPDCFEIQPEIISDDRGEFVKTFHSSFFKEHQMATNYLEEYFSISYKGVLRGLHFQSPPREHAKIIYCLEGCVVDAVVDLRRSSKKYGEFECFELSAKKSNMLYVPPGLAHGFYVLSDRAVMVYKVTSEYSSEHDTGVLWDSVGIPWPDKNPIISVRDSQFVKFNQLKSPFS